jgi:cytochrome c-type biogenesis protein
MGPMLGIAFKIGANNLTYGVVLISLYGVGHCAVIIFAGTFTGVVQQYLNWNEKSNGAVILKKVCGMLVILGGVWIIYIAP